MAKLKGIKKLNKVISAQLKPFGIDKAFLDNEFCFYPDKDKVAYTLTYSVVDEWFNEYVKQTFNYEVKYTFIISLLHEIGHYNTLDLVPDKAYLKAQKQKAKIDEKLKDVKTEDKEKALHFKYFGLSDEIVATEWAVAYAKAHPKKIRKMWHKIYPAIMEFYALNKIHE